MAAPSDLAGKLGHANLGELFDLEALAETCEREGRCTLFLTSVPLNYRGAVASPPNWLALF